MLYSILTVGMTGVLVILACVFVCQIALLCVWFIRGCFSLIDMVMGKLL